MSFKKLIVNNTISFYMSFSVITSIPLSINNWAVMPLPGILVPVNVPSYTNPQPHDGLFDFKIALVIFNDLAILNTSSAPLTKLIVTSSPSLFITFLLPSIILISEGVLGVVNPPNCSGHTSIASPFSCFFLHRNSRFPASCFPIYSWTRAWRQCRIGRFRRSPWPFVRPDCRTR